MMGKKEVLGRPKERQILISLFELVYLHLIEFHPHLILLCSWESVTVA